MSGERAQDFTNVIKSLIKNEIGNIHTILPGIVDSFDPSGPSITVRPAIRKQYDDGEVLAMPLIYGVPVVFLRSSKCAISFPLEKGDSVLLLFSERSIDEWVKTGSESTPSDTRTHDISDAIAIPGLFAFEKGKKISSSDLVIEYKDQTIKIKSTGDIEIGNSFGVKALVTEGFLKHTHSFTGAVSGSTCSGTTLPAVEVVPSKTSKVKAE
jgi:hypothetical protein